jgi:hypothetical protein
MAEAKERKTAIYERIFELHDGALGKGFGVVPERKVGDARYPWLGGMDVFTQVYSVLCTYLSTLYMGIPTANPAYEGQHERRSFTWTMSLWRGTLFSFLVQPRCCSWLVVGEISEHEPGFYFCICFFSFSSTPTSTYPGYLLWRVRTGTITSPDDPPPAAPAATILAMVAAGSA